MVPSGLALLGVAAALLLSWKIFEHLNFLALIIGTLSSIVLGVSLYLHFRLRFSPRWNSIAHLPLGVLRTQRLICQRISELRGTLSKDEASPNAPIITRNIDQAINEILDLALRDYVFSWFEHLMTSSEKSKEMLKKDLWQSVQKLSERLEKVDQVKLFAVDVVKKVSEHFESIRVAREGNSTPSRLPNFYISPHLMSKEREIEYLIKISEAFVIFVLPPSYGTCLPVRHLVREILARHLFSPAIDLVTSPDFINAKILAYIQKNQSVREISRKTFVYADSFEEFVALISDTSDVNEVRQMRYNILTEIMQATTVDNLRRAKGAAGPTSHAGEDNRTSAGSTSDLLSPRHMKRYINQLVHAKGVCERRLRELGCDRFQGHGRSSDFEDKDSISFKAVMDTALTRRFFFSYLEEENQQDLLGFWAAVEELRTADKTLWHQLATEIFYSYINKPSGPLQVQRSYLKRIEAFLIGDTGPDVFFELQENVRTTLRDTYFPAFLLSEKCFRMLDEAQKIGLAVTENSVTSSPDSDEVDGAAGSIAEMSPEEQAHNVNALQLNEHSGFAKTHMETVTEKLQNKLQALSVKNDMNMCTVLRACHIALYFRL